MEMKRTMMSNLPAAKIMKTLAALIAVGLVTGLAAPVSADSGPGTSISFRVYPSLVTVSGGPGIVVTRVWSHGVLTISAD
jgi:hypothetical protein